MASCRSPGLLQNICEGCILQFLHTRAIPVSSSLLTVLAVHIQPRFRCAPCLVLDEEA